MSKKIEKTYDIENKENDYKIDKHYNDNGNLKVDWKNIPTIDNLNDEMQSGENELMAQLSKIIEWHSYRDGEINFDTSDNGSKFVYRLVKKQSTWQYPNLEAALTQNDALFELSDSMPMNRLALFQLQDLLNFQFTKENDYDDFLTRYIAKTVDDGTSIIKISWDREIKRDELIIPIEEYDMDTYTDIISPNNGDGSMTVVREIVVRNQPVFEFCDIENVTIDPSAKGDISKAKYVRHRFRSTLSDLKEDGRYFNLSKLTVGDLAVVPEDFSLTAELDWLQSNGVAHIPNKELIVNEYWGYYDIDNDGVSEPVVISWINETIVRMEKNPYPLHELPFELVQCLPKVNSNYGDSPTDLITDNQDIISAILRGVIDLTGKKALGQKIYRKGAFDRYNRHKLQAGEDCEINPEHNPQEAIYTQNFEDIPQIVPWLIGTFNNEAESLTGVKAFSSNGITGDSMGSTATGVRSAVDAVSKREASILRRLASGLKKLAIKVARLDIELLSDEEIMLKTGSEQLFIERTQYQPLFGMNINISSPEIRAAKAERLAFLLQTTGNNMDERERRIYQAQISRLDGEESMSKAILNFKPQPDQFMQEMQQLQLEEQKAKIYKEKAQAEHYLAMAKQAGSKADLDDLEFTRKIDGSEATEDVAKQATIEKIKQESKNDTK